MSLGTGSFLFGSDHLEDDTTATASGGVVSDVSLILKPVHQVGTLVVLVFVNHLGDGNHSHFVSL